MEPHIWIEGILIDIIDYAEKNSLFITKSAVSDALKQVCEEIKCEQNDAETFANNNERIK